MASGRNFSSSQTAADGLRQAIRPGAEPVSVDFSRPEPEIQFQRGLYHSDRYNNLHRDADFERALTAFRQVLELDPNRADAASGDRDAPTLPA
jgi:hypothetical protein